MNDCRPTNLISDELLNVLEASPIEKISFKTISRDKYPWEITKDDYENICETIHNLELDFQLKYPFKSLVCMTAGDAMYWIDRSELEAVLDNMERTIQSLQQRGPMPVWKYTTEELLFHHLRNIKRLILAVAHDSVAINRLEQPLGNQFKVVSREFERAKLRIFDLLESLHEFGSQLSNAFCQDIVTLERCRITETMLQKGETSEEELGYTLARLNEAIDALFDRCREKIPNAHIAIRTLNAFGRNALRESENTQLLRASRWEMLQSLCQNAPKETLAAIKIATFERRGMTHMVRSREIELGASEMGQQALADAAQTQKEALAPDVEKDPVDVEPNVDAESVSASPKRINRMVVRKRRAYA